MKVLACLSLLVLSACQSQPATFAEPPDNAPTWNLNDAAVGNALLQPPSVR